MFVFCLPGFHKGPAPSDVTTSHCTRNGHREGTPHKASLNNYGIPNQVYCIIYAVPYFGPRRCISISFIGVCQTALSKPGQPIHVDAFLVNIDIRMSPKMNNGPSRPFLRGQRWSPDNFHNRNLAPVAQGPGSRRLAYYMAQKLPLLSQYSHVHALDFKRFLTSFTSPGRHEWHSVRLSPSSSGQYAVHGLIPDIEHHEISKGYVD